MAIIEPERMNVSDRDREDDCDDYDSGPHWTENLTAVWQGCGCMCIMIGIGVMFSLIWWAFSGFPKFWQ
jgi:hypothetical protein